MVGHGARTEDVTSLANLGNRAPVVVTQLG
jgi:hypothetical protein